MRLADLTVKDLSKFVCGSNQADLHRKFISWELLGGIPKTVNIRKAKAGDTCVHNPEEKLIEKRGVEVGHIFQLGKKESNRHMCTVDLQSIA